MNEYFVLVEKTLCVTVPITALSVEHADEIGKRMVENGDIELTLEDFSGNLMYQVVDEEQNELTSWNQI